MISNARSSHFSRIHYRVLIGAALLLFTLLSVDTAQAANYRTCFRWQAQTIDSGFGEDRLSWANGPTSLVSAYGVRVRFSQGGWARTYDASSSTGCANWSTSRTGNFNVVVYAYVKDSNNNVIRYHDAGDSAFGSYPGSTYSLGVTGYQPSSTSTTYLNVGSWGARWTAMATASMVSKYFPGRTSNTQIHMADSTSCSGASAHHCSGGNCLYSNGDTYVRLTPGTCSGSSEIRRRKFITAHEIGHARAILHQGRLEPNVSTTLSSGGCNNGSSYSMNSRERNSVGMREGFAHYVATRTFNRASEGDGIMRWFNSTFDIEFNSPHQEGGRAENNCGGAVNGQSTNLDVVRMLWDWTTPSSGNNRASRAAVMDVYKEMVDSSPSSTGYYNAFYSAADDVLSDGLRNQLRSFACWNGLIDLDDC